MSEERKMLAEEGKEKIWDEHSGDTPEITAIRRRIKLAWDRNDREHSFEYNGKVAGLLEAIKAIRETPKGEGKGEQTREDGQMKEAPWLEDTQNPGWTNTSSR